MNVRYPSDRSASTVSRGFFTFRTILHAGIPSVGDIKPSRKRDARHRCESGDGADTRVPTCKQYPDTVPPLPRQAAKMSKKIRITEYSQNGKSGPGYRCDSVGIFFHAILDFSFIIGHREVEDCCLPVGSDQVPGNRPGTNTSSASFSSLTALRVRSSGSPGPSPSPTSTTGIPRQ